MFDYTRFGSGIRYFRKKANLSLETLSELADITVPHLIKIETGNVRLSARTLVALCNALKIGINDCLNYDSDPDRVVYRQFKSEVSDYSSDAKRLVLHIIQNVQMLSEG